MMVASLVATGLVEPAQALGFKKELKKKKIPIEQYTTLENGLKMYDLIQGRGSTAEDGQKATVHYDCLWSGLDVVSSRSARLLGENRTLSEPFEFVVGQPLDSKAKMSDFSGGGLFSGMGGPKPPPALSTSVRGMKVGGKRSIIVSIPELGYPQGEQEIPPGATFELQIELLSLASQEQP
jgi:peptidylprolyl isomerase